jgi:hypothetical protein
VLCSTKTRHVACLERAPDTQSSALSQNGILAIPLIRLIVDVQVCIRELLYGRERLLDCIIGLKPHCDRLDVLSVCANRSGLMIRELVKKDFRFGSTNPDRPDRPL